MAGGVFKSVGIALLLVGGLFAAGGGMAAFVGFEAEQQNQDHQGLFTQPSKDESERNQVMMAVGGMAIVAGLALLVVGGVFVGVGSARQNRALVDAIAAKGSGPRA